jgi:hypothetical protein
MAKLECSKSAAVLYALNEGLFQLEMIQQEDYELLAKRYGRKLKDVIAEGQGKREPIHLPVVEIEKRVKRPDFSTLALEELQELHRRAETQNDVVEIQLLVFEANKRGIELKQEGAI